MIHNKTIFITCAVLLLGVGIVNVQAQEKNEIPSEKKKLNTIYLELMGTGIIYTFNYERAISEKLHLRVGGMYLGFRTSGEKGGRFQAYSFPVMVNKMYGNRRGKLEIGGGILVTNFSARFGDDEDTGHSGLELALNHVGITGTLGYRHNLKSGGLIRIGLQPRFLFGGLDEFKGFSVSPGISFGAAF